MRPDRVSRVLVVVDDFARGEDLLARAVEEAREQRARIDLVGVPRLRRLVWALARTGCPGIDVDELEREELENFAAAMRAAVSTLPPDVGVTVRICKGKRSRISRELMATGRYQRLLA